MDKLFCKKCQKDVDFYTEVKANNNVARCSECDSFIKNIPYEEPKFYVGKYKNIPINQIIDKNYLEWAAKEMKLSKSMRDAIKQRISEL